MARRSLYLASRFLTLLFRHEVRESLVNLCPPLTKTALASFSSFSVSGVCIRKPQMGRDIGESSRPHPKIIALIGASFLLLSTVTIFLLATAHIALSLVQLLQAFTNQTLDSTPGGDVLYWELPGLPVAKGKEFIQIITVRAQAFALRNRGTHLNLKGYDAKLRCHLEILCHLWKFMDGARLPRKPHGTFLSFSNLMFYFRVLSRWCI